jgi:ABC-type sugar transport system substrate-binding protein
MISIRPLSRSSRSSRTTTTTTTIRPIIRTLLLILLLTFQSSAVAATDDNDDDNGNDLSALSLSGCIDRTKIPPIKVIVHGDTKNDLFWKQIIAGMNEISKTMNIPIDIVSTIYSNTDTDTESNNPNIRQNSNRNDIFNGFKNSGSHTDSDSSSYIQAMVADIQKYDSASSDNDLLPPSAIIVSLPEDNGSNASRILNDAIEDLLQNTNIPIFGINAIPSESESSSSIITDDDNTNLYGTVSMNNTDAGIIAGNYIKELLLLSKSSDSSDSNSDSKSDSNSDSKSDSNAHKGVYINHQSDVHTLTERYHSISKTTNDILSWEMFNITTTADTGTNIDGDHGSTLEDQLTTLFIGCSYKVIQLAASNDIIVDAAIKALVSNGCNIGGNGKNNHVILGTFDTSTLIYDAISHGTIQYTISQQPYLQGSYSMLMAALYVTTNSGIGNNGIGSGNNNNIQTGPILVTSDNVPYEKDQIQCENDNYPVCHNDNDNNNNDDSSNEKSCPCIDRSKISISVITHDDGSSNSKDDAFWETLNSGITQAAIDFGVTIEKNKFISPRSSLRNGNHNNGYIAQKKLKHNFNIGEACSATTGMNNDKMHGVIVTIPDKNMMNSLSECISRNVPYLIMNANAHGDSNSNVDGGNDNGMGVQQVEIATDGTTTTTTTTTDDGGGSLSSSSSSKSSSRSTSSSSLPLYIGQKDYKSGYDAGKRLLLGSSSKVKKGWCIVHSNYDTLYERCRGMKDAFLVEQQKENNDVEFIDIISVPNNGNSSTYKYIVESAISNHNRGGNNDNDDDNDGNDNNDNDNDDWSEYGILSTGRIQIPSLISLVNDHPKLIAGTFDTDPALYQDDGNTNSQLIFAIDQNAYMQGYLSVATMVLKIITESSSSSGVITTTTTNNNNIIETGPNFIDLLLTSNNDNPSDDTTVQIKKQLRQFENNYKLCAPTSAISIVEKDVVVAVREEPPLKLSGKCKELGRLCEICEG